ncbi:MAG: hypothetical protein AMDU4_FER2C00131G0001, partial [Ferroplasma sp. Type II]
CYAYLENLLKYFKIRMFKYALNIIMSPKGLKEVIIWTK